MLHLKRILLVTLLFPSLGLSQEADIQAGKSLFNSNCAACHQLNRKAVGPALRGVTEKYDKEWLYSWIKNGTQMIKDGDPLPKEWLNRLICTAKELLPLIT